MRQFLLIGLIMFFWQTNSITAQNEKFKALFMYNFTKFLEWPVNERQGDFVITVLGDSEIVTELKIIAEKKKVGFQPMVIKNVSKPEQIEKSHIVFITNSKSNYILKVKEKLHNACTVIITDDKDAISKGVGINYVVKGGRQIFEIKKENIEEHNVKVGSDLLSLGIQK